MQKLQLTGANRHRKPDALSTLSAVVVDGDDVRIDNGAIHGKAYVEKGIRFLTDPDDVPNPRRVAVVWATLHKTVLGTGINGLGASVFHVDPEAGVGYKNLADQVNKMDAAVKGRVMLAELTQKEHRLLGAFLMAQRAELWENAREEVWAEWLAPEERAQLKARIEEEERRREEIRLRAEAEAAGSPPPAGDGLRFRHVPRGEPDDRA